MVSRSPVRFGSAANQAPSVVKKRQYPSSEKLKEIDAICISGSFVDDAGTDTAWISRLCGFVRSWKHMGSISDMSCRLCMCTMSTHALMICPKTRQLLAHLEMQAHPSNRHLFRTPE